MTGLPQLQLLVRNGSGLYQAVTDRSGDVILVDGWNVTRGRSDEFDDVDPSQLRLTLDNDDATYSPGGALPPGTWVRLQVVFGGQTYVRFTGPIDAMPITWPSPLGNVSEVPLEANDSQTVLSDPDLLPALRGNLVDEVTYDPTASRLGSVGDPPPGPVLLQYVPLSDVEGTAAPVVFASATQTLHPMSLGVPAVGPPVFGSSDVVLPDPEQTTGAAFFGDQWLTSLTPFTGATSLMVAWRTDDPSVGVSSILAGVLGPPAPGGAHIFLAIRDGQLRLLSYSTGQVTEFDGLGVARTYSTTFASQPVGAPPWNPCDGQWHVAVLFSAGDDVYAVKVHLDDDDSTVAFDTGLEVLGPLTFSGSLVVGGLDSSALYSGPQPPPAGYNVRPFTGDLAQVAVHGASVVPVDQARARDLVTALRGNPADASHQRIARLLRLGGAAVSPDALDVGALHAVPPQVTAERAVWDAVDDVADAEGGLVFIDPATGQPVFQSRTRRVLNSTVAATAATFAVGDYEHDDLRMEIGGRRAPVPTFGLLAETDQRRIDGQAWYAARADGPRLNSVTVDLLTLEDPAKIAAILALRLGDRIAVTDLPIQSPINPADLLVEGWSERCTDSAWSITFNTVPASGFRAWVLGDPTWGVLDATTKLHF